MSFSVQSTPYFERQLKRLAKKFASLKAEYARLLDQLEANSQLGTSLGHDCYKIRLAVASKGKGKSGGARVITHVHVTAEAVYLLAIYDKSEQGSISDRELVELLKQLDT